MNLHPSLINNCLYACLCLMLISCSSSQQLIDNDDNFTASDKDAENIVQALPDYTEDLQTASGKGRAIVSEPGNTERVTILFSSNREKSKVTIRNGLGIEGGELLTDGDTLLVYNKVDKYARKIPVRGAKLDRINRLASLNILNMLNYSVQQSEVDKLLENENLYLLQLTSGTRIYIDKETIQIRQIEQPPSSDLPYSKIEYSAYASIDGFTLPRRISIFGPEQETKIALQLTALDLNATLESLTITLPDDIRVYYQ